MANKAKVKCVVCNKKKGKRNCRVNDESLICPTCCADIRTPECYGCQFYNQAGKYAKDKLLAHSVIAPEVTKHIDEALELIETGDLAAGKKIVLEEFAEHEDTALLQYAMSAVLLYEKRDEEALTCLNKAIELDPFMLEAFYNRAMVYYKMGDIANVIINLRQVIELGVADSDVVAMSREKISELAALVKKLNNLTLDEYILSNNFFRAAYDDLMSENWAEAIAGFKAALAINVEHVQSYGNMGIAYMQLNKRAEAIKALEKALDFDPDYEPSIMYLAHINSCQGDIRVATDNGISIDYYKMKVDAMKAAEQSTEAVPTATTIDAEVLANAAAEQDKLSDSKLKTKPVKRGLLNKLFGK